MHDCTFASQRPPARLAALLLLAAAGCGGAGGGDLQVNYFYLPARCAVFSECVVGPTTDGLGSQAATFTITSGSLPAGLTLDPHTGVISGVPLAVGASTFIGIDLSVSGYKGALSSGAHLEIAPLHLVYDPLQQAPLQGVYLPPFELGLPIVPDTAHFVQEEMAYYDPGRPAVVLGSGVAVHFAVADGGALPVGLALDPVTGTISGSPAPGAERAPPWTMAAHLAYQGLSLDLSQGVVMAINGLPTFFGYQHSPDRTALVDGTAVTFTPDLTTALRVPGSAMTGFLITSGDLPPGLALDAATGVISGTPSIGGFPGNTAWRVALSATLTQGSATATLTDQDEVFIKAL